MTEIKKLPQRQLDKALRAAAIRNDIVELERMLDAGARIDGKNLKGQCAFHLVRSDHHPLRSMLLARGANIEAKDCNGRTALHNEALGIYGHGKTGTQWLMDRGANIEAIDKEGATPLCLASMVGQLETCQLLLDRGARMDAGENTGDTPLARSVMYGQYLITQWLIDRGADTGCVNLKGDCLFSLAIKAHSKQMCWRLIANGAAPRDVKTPSEVYRQVLRSTPLEAAVRLGDAQLLVHVLERDPDPDSLPERASQALALANEARGDEVATLLRSWLAKLAMLEALAQMDPHAKPTP